jgi:hypothetical protein
MRNSVDTHCPCFCFASVAAAALLFTVAPLRAQSTGCDPIYASQAKLLATPHHGVTVDSAGTDKALRGGKPRTSESISTGGAMYILIQGKWQRSRLTIDYMKKQEAENIRNTKSTCTFVRNETVNGEPAALYSVHSVTDFGASDGQDWISRSRGLPLRTVVSIDAGGAAAGKSRMVTSYDYANVRAPAGVQ